VDILGYLAHIRHLFGFHSPSTPKLEPALSPITVNKLIAYLKALIAKIVDTYLTRTTTRRPMGYRLLNPRQRFSLFLMAGLLVVGLTSFSLPALGQLISLPKNVPLPPSNVIREGNLDIGKVTLDGKVLFSIAAPATLQSGDANTMSPIERRVKGINYYLSKIVNDGFDRQTLSIAPAILNDQTVLVASDQNWGPRYLLTVTAADIELNEPLSIEETAQKWSETILQALLQSHLERQFPYQKQQISWILALIMTMLMVSFVIRHLQKWRRSQRHLLEEKRQILLTLTEESHSDDALPMDLTETFLSRSQIAWYQRFLPQISLENQIEFLLILRPILFVIQLSLWFGGPGLIFVRFPQTRELGNWLLRFPLAYGGILLIILLSKPILDSICRLTLTRIVDIVQEKGIESSRLKPRALTILYVLKQFNIYLIIIFGFLLFAYFINGLYFALIILAGLAFLIQNVLQDFVKIYFILLEDQYALGDNIKIGEVSGTVERISLRNSQIRTVSGDLFIVSHSSFNQVTNFTHGQSGIRMLIDVAYHTDLDGAMAVIKQVAEEMQQDSHWGDYKIQPDVKGVENFGDNSITILLILKTKLNEQWTVAREYRRRLKSAFDRQGISMPFPQRSIWFENRLAMVEPSKPHDSPPDQSA
jgi:small conductance mechanosensitive channel